MSISSMHSMHTTNSESKDEYRSVRSSTSSQTFRDPVNGSRKGTKETVLLNSEETIPQTKQRIYFSCPPQGLLNKVMTNGIILFMSWCLLLVFLGNEVLPNGSLFGLVIIFYSACVGGILLQLIRIPPVPPLPPLLGMLLAGFIIRNIPSIAKHVKVPTWWSSTLRSTALTVILIRAGLGLDPKVLQQMKTVCFRLSFGPCLVEACSAAVFSHFIMDFPWQWGFLLGFVLGAVSPAVVVPSMLRLQEAGYGAEKGIPTLLVAASSMDDIVAITGFNTFLNLIFSKGSVLHNILSTVWDVLVGVLIGIVFGVFIQYFPSEDQAVLGPLALETARLTAPHLESYAKDVMTVAFLAILVTAPNGALFIGILGPRFLTRHWDPSKVKLHLPALEGH
ncbi:sodium/hydrogen exchanger 9B1 isoform X8 [Cavia porcellus]|uniref:sodium/hydrogen exchanger 9B1 isoform X8 n=1 Tax=Cavia porcellus TaxID=10141 RepID=UPI002FE3DA06